jgi:CubicO group peptidase (beta-lactamase class C family)
MTRHVDGPFAALAAALALLLCSACGPNNDAASENVALAAVSAPGDDAAPLRTRIQPEVIKNEVAQIGRISSLILYQHDEVALEYFANGAALDRPINIKSASKSLLNALVGIALDRGELKTLDAPISNYLPKYFERIPRGDPRREITIRHLLTLSSGQPSTSIYNYGAWVTSKDWIAYSLAQTPVAPPGGRFTYSTGDTHLLAAVLTKAVDMPLCAYAQRHLFDPLGEEIGAWDRDPQGVYFGGNNVALSPKALLKFGKLYLDGGRVEGRQILTPEWIKESWTPRFIRSSFNGRHDYGYLWWRADFGGHSTWFAWGYGGQFLFVIPSLDAVVVVTGDPDAPSRGGNEVIYALMDETIVPYLARTRKPTS